MMTRLGQDPWQSRASWCRVKKGTEQAAQRALDERTCPSEAVRDTWAWFSMHP